MQLLPIPTLKETTEKFMRWSSPFLSDLEYQETANITEHFQKTAEPLQNKLIEKQQNSLTSWLYQDWIDAYLSERSPVSLSSNFVTEILPDEKKDLNFLISFIEGLSQQASLWQKKDYPQEKDNRGNNIDMSQFDILSGYCRIPKKDKDSCHFAKQSRHIAIYYQDRLYKLTILDQNFDLNCLPDFDSLLKNNINDNAISLSTVGFMPSDVASVWRDNLIKSNKDYFSVIEDALFVITLTNTPTKTPEEKMHHAMFLNGCHGWVLKSMHFIFNLFDNTLWANFEHTYQDAGTLISILKNVKSEMDKGLSNSYPKHTLKLINENLTKEQENQLLDYQCEYRQKARQITIKPITIPFSENILTKYSVDALTQILHIYAMVAVIKEPRGIYEAVAIPHFRSGRTECVRPLSQEMWQFCSTLLNETNNQEELKDLFTKAIYEHKERIKMCKKGLGVDRHLLGLNLIDRHIITEERERKIIESLFNSKAYQRESENFFSTSSLGNSPLVGVLIYNPAMEGGYGLAYGYNEENLLWHISYNTELEDQAVALSQALNEGAKKLTTFLNCISSDKI